MLDLNDYPILMAEIAEIRTCHKLDPINEYLIDFNAKTIASWQKGDVDEAEARIAVTALWSIINFEHMRERNDIRLRKTSSLFKFKPPAGKEIVEHWSKFINKELLDSQKYVHSARVDAIRQRMKELETISEDELQLIWLEMRRLNVEQDFRKKHGLTPKQKIDQDTIDGRPRQIESSSGTGVIDFNFDEIEDKPNTLYSLQKCIYDEFTIIKNKI
jgi:hypothetical protein